MKNIYGNKEHELDELVSWEHRGDSLDDLVSWELEDIMFTDGLISTDIGE